MSPTSGMTVEVDDSIAIMSPPLIDNRLEETNKDNDCTASSSTPATSTSSSPYLQPSSSPHIPSGFALQLNNAISSGDLEEDSSNDNNNAASSLSSCNSVIASPASQKSLRTHNPIRAIVDPIMAHSIKCGKERGDGKDQISLAVSMAVNMKSIVSCSDMKCCALQR